MDIETATQLANLFKALSDPTRLRILDLLQEGEIGVGEVVEKLDLTKSAISHQLRGLRDKHIIRVRKKGRHVFVRLDDEHIKELFQRGLVHIQHE